MEGNDRITGVQKPPARKRERRSIKWLRRKSPTWRKREFRRSKNSCSWVIDIASLFTNSKGEEVVSEDKFFVVHIEDVESPTLSKDNWTDEEHELVSEYRWWSLNELRASLEEFKPSDIADLAERFT